MNTSHIKEISRESWSVYVFFIIGYFASMFSALSSDLRDNNLTLAVVMMAGFSILAGVGIWIQAKSNIKSNERMKKLETKIDDLEKAINKMKSKE